MNTFKWFSLFSFIALFIYLMNKAGYVFNDFVQFYVNDLLVVPLTATLAMWFMRMLLQQKKLALRSWQILFIVMMYSLLFEALLPHFIKRYAGDPVDVLMYIAGGLFFYKVMNC
jgi:hypothetical protein